MELFYPPGVGVLSAGIALYNVYECVPVVKTSQGTHGSLCREANYNNTVTWTSKYFSLIFLLIIFIFQLFLFWFLICFDWTDFFHYFINIFLFKLFSIFKIMTITKKITKIIKHINIENN